MALAIVLAVIPIAMASVWIPILIAIIAVLAE
jgi:hypothetical protein